MEHQLRLLKQHRNSLVPVCRLPVELLARIMSLLQHSVKPNRDLDFDFIPPVTGWGHVMRVCAHFRAIAVQTPMLWNTHDFTYQSSAWRELSLSRAAGVPSCIRINQKISGEYLRHAWKAVVRGVAVHRDVLDVFATPELRTLALYSRPHISQNAQYKITRSFLGGSPLPLTHLKIEGSGITLNSPLRMPLLRRLALDKIDINLSFEALAELFEHTPMLEELSIVSIYLAGSHEPVYIDTVITVPARILLPRLTSMVLIDTPAKASAFIRFLPLPSTALHIEVVEPEERTQSGPNDTLIYNTCLSFLNHLPDSGDLTRSCATMSLFDEEDEDFNPTLEFGQYPPLEHSPSSSPASPLNITCRVDGLHPLFSRVTEFRTWSIPVSSRGTDLSESWGSRFFPNLHTLVLLELDVDDSEYKQDIKTWLTHQEGRIKCVEFRSCSPLFRPLFESLQREKLVSQAIWM
jgi:hypothetical protein